MKLRTAICDDQREVLESLKEILYETDLVSTVIAYKNIRELRDDLQDGKEGMTDEAEAILREMEKRLEE